MNMNPVRHPVWRALAILALLVLAQLSYAGELCSAVTRLAAPAQASGAASADAMSAMSVASDTGCDAGAACPQAERWAAECVSFPCFPELTDDEIEAVCRAIR